MKNGFLSGVVLSARSILFALLALCCMAPAQTVRPLINELGNPAKGRVEYFNDANVPLNVVIEAKSFSVSEAGEISYRPLESNIHLKLSATSFRIPPQQSYYLFYEAQTDNAPAWFVIYAAFSGFGLRTQEGMNVRVQLPHTVYLLPKGAVGKADIRIVSTDYDQASRKLRVVTENSGPYFGRVLQVFLTSGRKHQEVPGFPLFPQSRRLMEYTWEPDTPPEKISLEFEKFKVESEVKAAP
jgi:hypothetical protein